MYSSLISMKMCFLKPFLENHQQFPEATGWLRLPSTQSGFAFAVDLLNGTTYQVKWLSGQHISESRMRVRGENNRIHNSFLSGVLSPQCLPLAHNSN